MGKIKENNLWQPSKAWWRRRAVLLHDRVWPQKRQPEVETNSDEPSFFIIMHALHTRMQAAHTGWLLADMIGNTNCAASLKQ